MTNCPNCAAPVTGRTCEYCGTVLDTSSIAVLKVEADYLRASMMTKELYEAAIKAVSSSTMTVNEARARLGLKSI